jgi:short subunit dehydrogenase-like uncharacterized protein
MLTVLVLGGYGFFGGRIATALTRDPRVRALIGGRDGRRAAAMALELGLPARHGVTLDAADPELGARLAELGVKVVVHTAGPFQGQDYAVARAAIAAGSHYVDLADGRAFVAGIATLDASARGRGVSVISGASSVPALSSAVVERHRARFADLRAIRIGIASGARAPGLATVRGIFGYLGKPFTRLENGAWVTTHGWLDLARHDFPAPLGRRLMGSCDVPDLEVFPQRYAGVRTVTFHAGFASAIGHLAVYAIAAAVRAGLLTSGAPFAAPLNRLARVLEPLISHRGGMFVTLEGTGVDGAPLTLTWSLIAARNHGPQIPCGAAIALVRKLAAGQGLPHGAQPCVGLLSVEEYLAPLRELDIHEVTS